MGFVSDIVGSIFGTDDAAQAQVDAANKAAQVQREMYEQTRADLSPFVNFGLGAIPMAIQAAQPIDREAALGQYYRGPEYAMLQEQASRNQMAANEAMGGMGATSAANQLAGIAPQLGMQHLGSLEAQQMDQFNRAMGMLGVGQASAAQTGAAGQNYASGASQAFQQAGQAKAQGALAPMQSLMGLAGLGIGAYGAGLF